MSGPQPISSTGSAVPDGKKYEAREDVDDSLPGSLQSRVRKLSRDTGRTRKEKLILANGRKWRTADS